MKKQSIKLIYPNGIEIEWLVYNKDCVALDKVIFAYYSEDFGENDHNLRRIANYKIVEQSFDGNTVWLEFIKMMS